MSVFQSFFLVLVLQGGFVGTLRIVPGSAPFSVDPDGTVRVKNSSSLDRESSSWIMFQVGLTCTEDGSVRQEFEDWSERRPPPPPRRTRVWPGFLSSPSVAGPFLINV